MQRNWTSLFCQDWKERNKWKSLETATDILYLMVKCFLRENNHRRSDKKKQKAVKILEKDVYVTPDEISEAIVTIADLTMTDDEYLQLTERSKM